MHPVPASPPAPALPGASPAGASLPLVPGFGLALGRVHELTGGARRTLAAMLARRVDGPVVWIAPEAPRPGAWAGLMPQGWARWAEPGRLLMVGARSVEDRLWAMEEALRARIAGLVVAELEAGPALTPVRRLLLAAEGGQALGLLLTPAGEAAGIESRWRIEAAHRPGEDGWRLELKRARMVPPGAWRLSADGRHATPEPGSWRQDPLAEAEPPEAEATLRLAS